MLFFLQPAERIKRAVTDAKTCNRDAILIVCIFWRHEYSRAFWIAIMRNLHGVLNYFEVVILGIKNSIIYQTNRHDEPYHMVSNTSS